LKLGNLNQKKLRPSEPYLPGVTRNESGDTKRVNTKHNEEIHENRTIFYLRERGRTDDKTIYPRLGK